MDSGSNARMAAVTFSSAYEAQRRVAGIAAAARVVRELADAGFGEVHLILPDGETLDERTWRDLRRVGGSMKIDIAHPGDSIADCIHLDGGERVPTAAAVLRTTGKAGDGPVSRWLNRPVSRRLSALLLHLPGIRPIHATIGTAMLALAMLACLVAGGESGLIAGALLFQAASIFDGVDGEIARATFRTSHFGAALDSVVDVATNFGFVLGLTVNLALAGSDTALALSAWGFGLFALGLAIIAWRSARARGPFSLDLVKHQYRRRFPGAAVGALIRFLTIVSSRDFFALLFAVLILAGLAKAVLGLFASAATVWILFVLGSIRLPAPPELAPQRG